MVTEKTNFWQILQNVKYYSAFQLIFVILVVLFSSVGAFFHFLLDHEISIVESWLHNNQWELLILSKGVSLYLISKWFRIRLYEPKSFQELVRELFHWPDTKAIVVSLFSVVSYLSLVKIEFVSQNLGYWYYLLTSYFGLFVFFGIEFILIAYLEDMLNEKQQPNRLQLGLLYTIIFIIAFRLSVPNYYDLIAHVVICYISLIFLSGKSFKAWSNAVSFLVIFVAPMGAFFGLDPVWGEDFSPFRLEKKLNLTLLAVIWMISFVYYNYRLQIIISARKLLR